MYEVGKNTYIHTYAHDIGDIAQERGVVDLKVQAKHAEQDKDGNR